MDGGNSSEEHVKEILGNVECLVNDLGNGATDVECKVKPSGINGLINDCYNEMHCYDARKWNWNKYKRTLHFGLGIHVPYLHQIVFSVQDPGCQ